MNPNLSLAENLPTLQAFFDPHTDAVFFLVRERIIYRNPAASALQAEETLSLLFEEAQAQRVSGEHFFAQAGQLFRATISVWEDTRLLVLRPLQEEDVPQFPFSPIPMQLRTHLTQLIATIEHLAQQLQEAEHFSPYQDLISMQTQASYRILRLTKQLELSSEEWETEFPKTLLDINSLFLQVCEELAVHLAPTGPKFQYELDDMPIFLFGNRELLRYLILALLSNAIKSAGTRGQITLHLRSKRKQVILKLWDSGNPIPDDRLSELFLPRHFRSFPRPNEGAGLDLWLTHRIAIYHTGAIMAGNRPVGGTEFTLSLPLATPDSLQFHSGNENDFSDGFSPLLVSLSDALPHTSYNPLDT